jgi:chemotaxis signal transduction protein
MDEQAVFQKAFVSQAHLEYLASLNDETFWNYANAMASQLSVLPDRFDEYLVCDLGKQRCVLPLTILSEVLAVPLLYTLLPAMPCWMRGLVRWRGNVIAVIDFPAYFTGVSNPIPSEQCMLLVAESSAGPLGLLAPVRETITNPDPGQFLPVTQLENDIAGIPPCADAIRGMLKRVDEVAEVEEEQKLLLLNMDVILADIIQKIRIDASA